LIDAPTGPTAKQEWVKPELNCYFSTPVTVGTTGQRMFFSDVSGVIRYSATGAGATSASPALQ